MFFWNSCFFDDSTDVSNLISGSFAFSKSSLNIWKFMVHVLLKSGLENFEHYFTSVWEECNCVVVWAFFGTGMKTDPFQSLSRLQLFPTQLTSACQVYWSFTISRSLLKLISIESVMSSNHLILCHPLLLLPSIFPSIGVFSSESVLHIRWPNY